jgi:hypothetical protein
MEILDDLIGIIMFCLLHYTSIALASPQPTAVALTTSRRFYSGAAQGMIREATKTGLGKEKMLYAFHGVKIKHIHFFAKALVGICSGLRDLRNRAPFLSTLLWRDKEQPPTSRIIKRCAHGSLFRNLNFRFPTSFFNFIFVRGAELRVTTKVSKIPDTSTKRSAADGSLK